MDDIEKDAMELSIMFSELNKYFDNLENRSYVKVKDLINIIIPYIRDARKESMVSYGKTLEKMKTFRAPMSKKNWEMIIDSASIKELENE
jgi:flagellar motor component MotA